MRALREYQSKAIDLIYREMAEGFRRVVLCLPTGGGKTLTTTSIIQRARAKGKKVLFIVKGIALIDQTVREFAKEGILDVGVIQADHWMTDYSKPVQVASMDTLRIRGIPETDLIVYDECHNRSEFFNKWMAENPKKHVVGLSATPWSKGMGKHFQRLVIAATTKQLIREGYLSPFKVYAPSHPDLTGVRTVAGDYHEGDLATAMDKPKLTGDVVSTYVKLGEGRPALCYAVNRAHARSLQQAFAAANISCGYVDGDTETADREVVRLAFERGDMQVVVNVGVLTTGVDWDVRCVILARPTKSEILFVQIVGRGLRTAKGKQDCLVLDHSDTTLNLGFVTDIHHDRLDDGNAKKSSTSQAKERPPALPKECPSCHRLKAAGVYTCPSCGFEPKKVQDVETRQGDLLQIGGKQVKATIEDKQRWYSMLLGHCRNTGKSPNWAYHLFKQKFGVYPAATLHRASLDPTAEVVSFIRSRSIAYAKAQEKQRRTMEARNAS